MEKTKVTKKQVLEAVRNYVVNNEVELDNGITVNDVLDYIDTTLDQLNTKAVKAQARAAEKKAEGDTLRDAIMNALTDELQTADEITATVKDAADEVTKAKVTARLTQLINLGKARKEQIKIDKRQIMAYAKPTADTEVEAEADAE